jgi:hypothetical protein
MCHNLPVSRFEKSFNMGQRSVIKRYINSRPSSISPKPGPITPNHALKRGGSNGDNENVFTLVMRGKKSNFWDSDMPQMYLNYVVSDEEDGRRMTEYACKNNTGDKLNEMR